MVSISEWVYGEDVVGRCGMSTLYLAALGAWRCSRKFHQNTCNCQKFYRPLPRENCPNFIKEGAVRIHWHNCMMPPTSRVPQQRAVPPYQALKRLMMNRIFTKYRGQIEVSREAPQLLLTIISLSNSLDTKSRQ